MRFKLTLLYIFFFLIFLSGSLPEERIKVPDYGGEIMQYNIHYGFLNVGEATISFIADSNGCGDHLRALARSTGFARVFKSVNYNFESCMDTITGLPNYA